MVGCPANPFRLAVGRGIHTQKSVARADLIDADSIDTVCGRTVDEEEIDLIGVIRSVDHATRVCSGATGGELDHASAKPSRLALSSEKPSADIDYQVIPVVGPIRDQHPVAALHQLGENDGFTALADVHGVPTQRLRCG